MSIAIHYSPFRSLKEDHGKIFGMQIAIGDFIRAYFRHARVEKFPFLISSNEASKELFDLGRQAGVDSSRIITLDARFPEKNLPQFSTIFRVEPDTRNLLWQRQRFGSFSFCGLAHAISGVEAGAVLEEYCLAPSSERDAIVCPSHAVRRAISSFWDSYADYLNKRFGGTFRCPVQLPVIPLGVDLEKFAAKTSPDKRASQRRILGLNDDDIVLLWIGRLSAAIKAHPIAMFQAAERAAALSGARVHLIMVGYFMPEEAEAPFKNLAASLCQKASVRFIPPDDPRFPDGLWAAGDIFLSLIDNIQESFGITPIEAMAAGLPRVVSDWDGYRDSVTDGEDGFLIPTTQPPPGNGFDLTADILSGREIYGGFLAKTALTVAVDAELAGDRLAQLIADKNRRTTMADKAKGRARTVYDWKAIIPAFEDLWEDLRLRKERCPHEKKTVFASAIPQLPDPYTMYEGYATTSLDESDRVVLAMTPDRIAALLQNPLNTYAYNVLVPPEDISALLIHIGNDKETTVADLFRLFPMADKPRLWRTIAWLHKLGIVKIHLAKRSSQCRV